MKHKQWDVWISIKKGSIINIAFSQLLVEICVLCFAAGYQDK